jgi:voltage-gated potassium channel
MSVKRPIDRLLQAFALFLAVFAASVVGYRFITGKTWLDSLYMVVITLATVGYGESSTLTPAGQWLTIAVIVVGISVGTYTLGRLVQWAAEGELDRYFGMRRMKQEIDRLDGHIIVCGFGRIGQILSDELRQHRRPFVVVESDPVRQAECQRLGNLVVQGDATDEETLLAAGIRRARTLVTALPSDAANVFITLTARELNPQVQIIARGELRSSQKKLAQAGADRVVLPATIGAQRIATMITRPSTLEFLDLIADRNVLEVELDELTLPPGCQLAGLSLAELDSRSHLDLLFVGIKPAGAKMRFHPPPDQRLVAGDVVVVLGRTADLERFRREYGL